MHVTNERPGGISGADDAWARRALAVDGGQEGPGGRLGSLAVGVGGPACGREPDTVLGPGGGRRLRGGAAARARLAVGGPRRPARGGGGARRGRGLPRARGPRRATAPRS